MKLGRMRYRAEFQRYKSGINQNGFLSKGWETEFVCWADVTAVSSREYLAANTETAETTVKIFVRYNSKISHAMRVKVGENVFQITSVLQNQRDGITTVMAKEWESGKDYGEAPGGDAEKAEPSGN